MKRPALFIAIATFAGLWTCASALAAEDWDACKMLLKADVDGAFAPRVFATGSPGHDKAPSSPKLSDVSSCTYSSAGASDKDRLTVTLLARRSPEGESKVTPQSIREGEIKLKGVPVNVPGLGGGAHWVNLVGSAPALIRLNVFRGKREWLVFSATSQTTDTDVAVTGLTQIAKAAVARM